MLSKEKFTALVLEKEKTLYRVAMAMLKNENDAQDAVQQAILLSFERLSTLKKEEYFSTWLVRVLINVCKKQLKKRRREVELTDNTADCYIVTEKIETKMLVESLPLKFREVTILYYIENFKVSEIAKILSVPQGTVKSRLSKARELLQSQLK